MKNSFIKGDTWRFKAKEGDPGQDGEKTGVWTRSPLCLTGHRGGVTGRYWSLISMRGLGPGFKNLRREPSAPGSFDFGKGKLGV